MPRLQKHLGNDAFLLKVLTDKERKLYRDIKLESHKLEFLCGRFGAKEAYSKAMGTGIGEVSFHDFEVLRNEAGAPVSNVGQVSISHDGDYCIVVVMI